MRIKKNWTMRKSIFTLVGIVMATASVMASTVSDKDRAIRYEELPADARTFIKHHYPNEQPTYMWEDKDHNHTEYKVVMANGVKLEFDERGNWTEVDTPNAMVPADIVPKKIADYVAKKYPANKIVEISKERNEWEVKLNNGAELEFDHEYHLVKVD